MASRKFPLGTLEKVRQERKDARVKGLAESVRAREEAERVTRELEARLVESEEQAKVVRRAEAAALEGGELTAADLARGGAWSAREAWEAEEQKRKIAVAARQAGEARTEEASAKELAAKAEADLKVVGQYRERWTEADRREREAAEEEGASDAWRPRR